MSKLTEPQRRWQEAALTVLLDDSVTVYNSPWIPASYVVEAIKDRAYYCSPQAASGALRALLTVGLADFCETSDGRYWKATDAATRFAELRGEADGES